MLLLHVRTCNGAQPPSCVCVVMEEKHLMDTSHMSQLGSLKIVTLLKTHWYRNDLPSSTIARVGNVGH